MKPLLIYCLSIGVYSLGIVEFGAYKSCHVCLSGCSCDEILMILANFEGVFGNVAQCASKYMYLFIKNLTT
jgi:hypothetical protein